MNSKNQKLDEAKEAVLDAYQTRTAQLHDLFAPTWNARADTLKTIVSISSASIVLNSHFFLIAPPNQCGFGLAVSFHC
jgi:hypothetical protein